MYPPNWNLYAGSSVENAQSLRILSAPAMSPGWTVPMPPERIERLRALSVLTDPSLMIFYATPAAPVLTESGTALPLSRWPDNPARRHRATEGPHVDNPDSQPIIQERRKV